MTLPIELRKNEALSRYEALIGSEVAGFAQYRRSKGTVTLPHVEVKPAYEGQGVGSRLAQYALDDVRAQGNKVVPLCPFIAAYIRRHPEYAALV